MSLTNLQASERKVYSQNGEDGVIEAIFAALGATNRFFVEFGVDDALECNTANLLAQGWTGLMMEGDGISKNPLATIRNEFITAENINQLFAKYNVPQTFDFLSIDIDGNDYWVWKAITYRPRVVVIEYNASVPLEFRLVIPYDPKFHWNGTDYFGAGLRALAELGESKGYQLVYCERNGANAFFIARSELPAGFMSKPLEEIYRPPNYYYQGISHRPEKTRGMIDPNTPDGGRITLVEARQALVNQLFQVASQFHLNGELGLAERYYRRILEVDRTHADAHSNLGVVLQATGRTQEAQASFARALESNPNHADAHNNLGNALKDDGRLAEAIECFHHALQANPSHANAYCNLGNAYSEQGHLPEAVECFRQALRCNPEYTNARFNLANALQDLGQLSEAMAYYRETLRSNPNFAKAHNNLGNLLKDQGQLAEAVACFHQTLRLEPQHVGAHINLAVALQDQGFFQEALAQYEKALRLDPGSVVALSNRSMVYLLLGDFEKGWPDYEHRSFQTENDKRYFRQPRWDGSPLNGQTILVFAEQGLGDTLQFIRYAPLVKERGGKVIFECQSTLANLVGSANGIDQIVLQDQPLPPFDVQVPLLSIPGILGTNLSNIPTNIPYLHADPKFIEQWRQATFSGEPKATGAVACGSPLNVGIVWQGNPKFRADRSRSIPLRYFQKLANVPGVHLVSLQVGTGTKQLATAPFSVTNLGSRFDPKSLDDLAGSMMNLDLLITSDTAVPHLAGALGVPIWVALSFVPDWRWLLEGSECMWYPTMRLFRQKRLGDWDAVFDNIAEALRSFSPASKNRG